MCIAIYKPKGVDFPSKSTLKTCFTNNNDGAGFMVATGKRVYISKGYMGFTSFWKALRSYREKYGDDKAFVLHFRISTMGGVRQDGCHPFPLSSKMNDMRKLDTSCDIGVAHNGIISLTSTGKGNVDYSDTMKFITEYLSLIIKDKHYYKDEDKINLIEKLCGSRLAILDGTGHCELIGTGWSADNGVWYSNDSYKPYAERYYFPTVYGTWDDYATSSDSYWTSKYGTTVWDEYDEYLNYDGYYEFNVHNCPMAELGDDSYCELCTNILNCFADENESEVAV